MAKTVPVNIKISLLNLTETLYRFNYDYDYSTIKPDDLKVDFIHSFKSDQEKGEFGVEVKARYKSRLGQTDDLSAFNTSSVSYKRMMCFYLLSGWRFGALPLLSLCRIPFSSSR